MVLLINMGADRRGQVTPGQRRLRCCSIACSPGTIAIAARLPWRAAPGHGRALSRAAQRVHAAADHRGHREPQIPEFLARFPSLEALAAAAETQVLHAWQGLGYYRRARALHALARVVVTQHGGRLPIDEAALRALPGIGPYTASALRAIASDGLRCRSTATSCASWRGSYAIETPLPAALPPCTRGRRPWRPGAGRATSPRR